MSEFSVCVDRPPPHSATDIRIITDFMEQSPSWEANSHSASQQILRLL